MFPPSATSAEIDEAIQDVLAWEDEVKAVDAALTKDKTDVIWETTKKGRVPVRGEAPIQARHNVQAAPKKPAAASTDKKYARDANTVRDYYSAWDKVNVDEMEQEVDADLLEEEALREEERDNSAKGDATLGAVPMDIPDAQRPAVAQSEKEKGDEAFTAKDFKEAVEYYRRSNAVLPKPATHSNCALTFMKLKDFDAAALECDRALRIEPRYMKAVHRRGKARYELGRYEDAVEDFQKAQAMHPNNATINADLMAARKKLKDSHPAALKKQAPVADTVTAKKESFQRVAIIEEYDSEEEGGVLIEEVSTSTGTAVPESGFKRVAVVEEDSEDEADAPAPAPAAQA